MSVSGPGQARCATVQYPWAGVSWVAPELPFCALQAVERGKRSVGAASGAGRKGQSGPRELRPRVAGADPVVIPAAALAGLRLGPGQRSPWREPPAPPGSGRPRVSRVLMGLSGTKRAGEPMGSLCRGRSVNTRVAMGPTSAGSSTGSVETGLLALPDEETEGGLLLYNQWLGNDRCRLGVPLVICSCVPDNRQNQD